MKHLIWPLLILLILVRYFISRPVFRNEDRVRISTTVYSDPVDYPASRYLKIVGLKTYLPLTPLINYGDKIVVEGKILGDKLDGAKIISVKSGSFLSNFRNKILDFYQNNLPQPMSGLLGGIVLGAKGHLDPDFYNKTKLTGVAHVVVASGTNVTFVAAFLSGILFLFLSRKKVIPFVIFGVALYLSVAGFDPPLIRAAVMSSVLFLGQEMGKLISPWRIFFLTAGLMLVWKPEWIDDVGFQLSFASTASLLFFEKKIEKWLMVIPKIIKQDFSTALAAQIGVSPMLFVIFGQYNPLSPLINALILWTIAPLMIIGTVGGTIGLILPEIGKLILWLGYPMLWWFVGVVNWFNG